jgi:hypothetical protein
VIIQTATTCQKKIVALDGTPPWFVFLRMPHRLVYVAVNFPLPEKLVAPVPGVYVWAGLARTIIFHLRKLRCGRLIALSRRTVQTDQQDHIASLVVHPSLSLRLRLHRTRLTPESAAAKRTQKTQHYPASGRSIFCPVSTGLVLLWRWCRRRNETTRQSLQFRSHQATTTSGDHRPPEHPFMGHCPRNFSSYFTATRQGGVHTV